MILQDKKKAKPWLKVLLVLWLLGGGATNEQQRREILMLQAQVEQLRQHQNQQAEAVNAAFDQLQQDYATEE